MPLDSNLDSACKFVTRIQELLVYVSATWPSLVKPSEKLIVVIPKDKNKKVRFVEPSTSSSYTPKQTDSNKVKETNKHVLPFTGVSSSTEARRSKIKSQTKINRIPRSNQKTKQVEDHPRTVMFNLNKTNRVSKPVYNANVKHSVLNANYELICATYNECMFDAIHDLYVVDYVNNINVRVKSKTIKSKKKKVWKPT
nr:hypothetical protein [Tanacetum cinerariifolium]